MIQKTPEQINLIKKACKIVKESLVYAETLVKPGISTEELDEKISQFILSKGATLPCKGYEGYPAGTCISVNDVVVHGIPSRYQILQEGDIISIDIVAGYKGYNGDAARTFAVGKISEEKQQLIAVTQNCFFKAIENLKAGDRVGKISSRVQQYAESFGYGVVRELTGHGIGASMHESPYIPNFGLVNSGPTIINNVCLAIEPMITMGKRFVFMMEDGWTIRTQDGLPSAHYENTVLVTEQGVEILTL